MSRREGRRDGNDYDEYVSISRSYTVEPNVTVSAALFL